MIAAEVHQVGGWWMVYRCIDGTIDNAAPNWIGKFRSKKRALGCAKNWNNRIEQHGGRVELS